MSQDGEHAMARQVLVLGAFTLAVATAAYAKAPLNHVTVSGGNITKPVTITDRDALRLSNPWHGNIADWKGAHVGSPPTDRSVYEITLHARMRGPEVRPIYQLRYIEGRHDQPGYVYLPGRGEPWYRQNVSIIYREGHDGHWHAAAPEWDAHIRRALRH
jgi:hypothetical protein